MRAARFGIIVFCCFMVSIGIVAQTALAQNGTCSALAKTALDAVKQSCGAGAANSVCLGYQAVNIGLGSSASGQFKTAGDRVNLADVTSLTTTAASADAKTWGIAILNAQAGLPEGKPGVTAILFGDATLTSDVHAAETDLPTLPVQTAAGVPVLLRGGAGPGYPSSLKLTPGQNAVVDGRNKAGDWVRVRLDTAVGWAYAPQVKITGDVKSLTVLDEQDTRADFLYKAPMQAFKLATGAAGKCGSDAPNGLLLQLTGDQTARLLVNGTDLALSAGTFFVRATPKDRLDIAAIAGSATVTVMGSSVTLNAGDWTRVRLGGKDGLSASAAPTLKAKYPFAAIDGAPVAALPTQIACTVGLSNSSARVAVRVGPGQERGPLFFMKPDASYKSVGWASDSKGGPWWKIDIEGVQQAWVDQAAVHSLGACDQVAKADIPPVIVAPPPDTSAGGDNNSGGSDTAGNPGDSSSGAASFVPAGPTIYNVSPGNDRLVGSCEGITEINYCPSLVQITPTQNGVLFKGQELQPYPMYKVRDNVYAYSGAAPEALGSGTIKLTLVFTSPTTWTVTRVLVLSNAPDCQHVYTFTGAFLR